MFFLLGAAIGAAVGAVAGACGTHAASEKDRQAAEHHRKVANELTTKYSALEKRYNEFAELSKKQINDLTRQRALDAVERDQLRLAVRLQQVLVTLMLDIDTRPSQVALKEFEDAVLKTNAVLSMLNEEPIPLAKNYFVRNLKRAKRLQKLAGSKKNEASSKKSHN